MNNPIKTNKSAILTSLGILVMILLTLTKVVPASRIASYAVFVGIGFFILVEVVGKTPNAESGLRFRSVLEDLKKTGVLLWALLPVVSAIATLIVGDLIFGRAFVDHVLGRTSAILSFDQIPLLVGQVILAAFGEEIAFRGFFVGKAMKLHPFWLCAVVSSIVFAAGHIAVGAVWLVIFDIATIFIDSILYAIIYRRSENCLISTFSHILCNAVAIAATFLFF